MQCQRVQQVLNAIVDGERIRGSAYLEVGMHCARCPRCRAAWKRLARQRRLSRSLSGGPASPELRARVFSSLPELEDRRVQERPPRRIPLAAGAAALGVGAILVLLILGGGSRDVRAEEVHAAIQRANTWHFTGWKEENGRRVAWEVWGRRQPYLYREQFGTQWLVDDGVERVQVFAPAQGKPLAVRTPSQRTPESARWSDLFLGTNWNRGAHAWKTTPDTVVFRWSDYGMQGPESAAHSYFFVDRATRLPRRWEYRHVLKIGERTMEAMQAEYNVEVPPSLVDTSAPAEATLVDAAASPDLPQGGGVQSAEGITTQLEPVKMAPDGTVLVRIRSWLGATRLDQEGIPLFSMIEIPYDFMEVNGQRHPWPCVDDRGRPYVPFKELRTGSGRGENVLNGDQLFLLVPLEPLPPGDPLPRTMQVSLQVRPGAWPKQGPGVTLGQQQFTWTVSLPAQPEPVVPSDYKVPREQVRTIYKEAVPLPPLIDAARAHLYVCQSDFRGQVRWLRHAIASLPPDSDYAQFLRGDLANAHRTLREDAQERAVLLQILETKRRYPKTWGHYARMARWTLAHPRGSLRKKQPSR